MSQAETQQPDPRMQHLEDVLIEVSNDLRDTKLREAEQRVLLRRQAQEIRELRGQLAAHQSPPEEPADTDPPGRPDEPAADQ